MFRVLVKFTRFSHHKQQLNISQGLLKINLFFLYNNIWRCIEAPLKTPVLVSTNTAGDVPRSS